MPDKKDGLTQRIIFRMNTKSKQEMDKFLIQNLDKYENQSHFIRVAIEMLLRKHKEGDKNE